MSTGPAKKRNLLIGRADRFGAVFCIMIALQGCLGEIEGNGRSQSVMFGGHDICTAGGFFAAEADIGNRSYPKNVNALKIDVYKNNVAWSGEKARLGQMSVSRCLTPPVNQSYVDQQRRDQASWQDDYDRALAAQQAANGAAFGGFLNGLAQGVAAYNSGYAASGGYYGGSGYPQTGGSGTGCGSECVVSDIRLKTNIRLVGRTLQGLTLYRFTYVPAAQIDGEFIGVMAQDLLGSPFADAVYQADSGFLMVDYGQLPIEFIRLQ